jgi:hypothetical protein
MCDTCIEDLTVAHKFKTSCIKANETFQNLLNAKIKEEINIEDDGNNNDWDDKDSLCSVKEEIDIEVPVCER